MDNSDIPDPCYCVENKVDMFDSADSQQMTYILIMKISSLLSIFGSSYILYDLYRHKESKLKVDPKHRIIFGLSLSDIIFSFWGSFMSNWMVPADSGWWGATGNMQTCTLQGFFGTFGMMGVLLYMGALSLNILLQITYGWSKERFSKSVERYIHIFIFVYALAYSIPAVPLNLHSPDCDWHFCVPTGYPDGDSDNIIKLAFQSSNPDYIYLIVYGCTVFVVVNFCGGVLVSIFLTARKQFIAQKMIKEQDSRDKEGNDDGETRIDTNDENENPRNDEANQAFNQYRLSRKALINFFLYLVSFEVCLIVPSGIFQLLWVTDAKLSPQVDFVRMAFYFALLPLQGFLNFLIYVYPRYRSFRREILDSLPKSEGEVQSLSLSPSTHSTETS